MFKKIVIALIAVAAAAAAWYFVDLPDVSLLQDENPQTSSMRILRENQAKKKGKTVTSFMVWRDLNRISPHLRHAVVLAEDDLFFQHNGFDVEALKKAAKTNWERKKFAFGASTITQQLARTLYLSSRKSLLRKAKEALITRKLENTLSKERILELYLNVVEWGPHVYGAEAASRHFFGKSAAELTPEEAVALASILPSPRRWNPLKDSGFMAQRKKILLSRMVRAKYIQAPVPPGEGEELPTDEFDSDMPDEDLPSDHPLREDPALDVSVTTAGEPPPAVNDFAGFVEPEPSPSVSLAE